MNCVRNTLKFVCKVLRPEPLYVYRERDSICSDSDIFGTAGLQDCMFIEGKVKDGFRHLKVDRNNDKDSFVLTWIQDPHIKCFNKIDFQPYNGIARPQVGQVFNLFTGYNPQILTPYDKLKREQILKPFHELGQQLCEGNEKYYKYFLSYFAEMIQHPNQRIPVSPSLVGPQGVGKNLFLKPLSYIIGRSHFMTSSKLEDFFGTHAEGFYHKLLVNPNEVEGGKSNEYEGEMKSAITEDTITINPKNVRPIEINNFARVILTSNKSNPFKIDFNSKERR